MNPATPHRSHYPALDGLRGIAILLVLLYHNFSFIPFFNYGWLGVDLFFVLSGFLITDILMNTMNTKNYFKNFYARRILRIFPLYYLSLVLFILILPSIPGFRLDMSYYWEYQWWFWTYLQNWTLVFHYNEQAIALNHFWSLAVEEQYYLVWPFIIIFIKSPRKLLVLCLTVLVFVIMARLYIWNHRDSFPSYQWLFLFTRVDGILIGSMLALIYHINKDALRTYTTYLILLLAGINFLIYFTKNEPNFPVWAISGYTTFAAVFALLVHEAVKRDNKIVSFIFTNPVLRFLGTYSYGFYIFHWPIYLIVKPYTDSLTSSWATEGSQLQMVLSAILASIVGLLVSIASYHLFEKHFLKLKKHFV